MANDTLDGAPHVGEATSAVLDDKHIGDIRGALGTIRLHDTGSRRGWGARLLTLDAIVGPGIIVMVGDNDAGGVSTYAQAGQNFGLTLLWTLPFSSRYSSSTRRWSYDWVRSPASATPG